MKYTYIANWKMNLNYHESLQFCDSNKQELAQLASAHNIVLCPSFVALAPMVDILKNTPVAIGAQNCSEYQSGPHTGEVSAQSLAQAGATYCFVGHQERRRDFGETTEIIIKKINLLLAYSITPIICIGETQEHFENRATFTVLTEQLKPIIENLNQPHKPIIIAYDPVWSIGTGIIPEHSYLEEIFAWTIKLLQTHAPDCPAQLFYGGSVNEKTIIPLKKVSHINGFLIGGASTDFARFKKIITAE